MTRAEVAAEAGARLAGVLAVAGIEAADEPGALKEPIDDALSAMGFGDDELADAAPTDRRGFLALVRYHALLKAAAELAPKYGVSLPSGLAAQRQHAFAQVTKLLELAEKDVVAHFGALDPEAGGVTALDLDFLDCGGRAWSIA